MKHALTALTIAVLFCGLFFVSTVQASTEISGVISSDTTWTKAGSPYTITKNTLVSIGVTLKIEPGVTVNINDNCYLQVNGSLNAKGTEGSKIYFNGGQIKFTYTSTGYTEESGTGSIFENCVFTSNMERQVQLRGGSPKISNNIFNNQLYLADSCSVVSNNIFNAPVHVSRGANLFLKNTFYQGLIFEDTGAGSNLTAQVLENVFTGYSDGSGIYVAINSISKADSLTIEKNLITKNHRGILVDTMFSPTIRYNTIVNNKVGIQLLDYEKQNSVIKYNTLVNEQNLVLTQWVGCPDIDASNNYWGTTDTGQIDNSIHDYYDDFNLGKVNYQPILNQPDGNAPASDLPTVRPTPIPAVTPSSTAPSSIPTQTSQYDQSSFNIQTNSSLTAFSFDSQIPQISFYVTGSEGTTGYVRLTIAKSLMPNAEQIQVYLDGNQINREVTSNGDSWQVTFTYHHSSHQVTINSAAPALPGWVWTAAAIAAALSITVTVGMIVYLKRKGPRIDSLNQATR